ncbi:hypothetical protein T12_15673, partial [Trichinella patagoniensis]
MHRCNLLSVKTDIKTMGITSSPELLWSFICSGHRDKSCSDHFVQNMASLHRTVTLKYFKVLIYFFHDSITLTSSEYDISSDGALYGLRHPMKLVPLATLVHMDIKAFPSRPSVPLLITNSIVY